MDLLKFDKRILERNVKKGLISVEERDKHLESLPDLEGEYEIVSIPLYDHEQPEEDEQQGTEVSAEAGPNPGEISPPPSMPYSGSPMAMGGAPQPVAEPVATASATLESEASSEAMPLPSSIPDPVRPLTEPVSQASDDGSELSQNTVDDAEETGNRASSPNLRPVGGPDDEGNPQGV